MLFQLEIEFGKQLDGRISAYCRNLNNDVSWWNFSFYALTTSGKLVAIEEFETESESCQSEDGDRLGWDDFANINKAVYTALGAPKHLYERVNEKA